MNKRLWIVGLLLVSLVILRSMINREGFQSGDGEGGLRVVIAKADWCGHCRKAAPEFEKMRQASPLRLPDGRQAEVKILDADQDKADIAKLGVKGFPTIMIQKGEEKIEYPGERTYDGVVNFLQQQ